MTHRLWPGNETVWIMILTENITAEYAILEMSHCFCLLNAVDDYLWCMWILNVLFHRLRFQPPTLVALFWGKNCLVNKSKDTIKMTHSQICAAMWFVYHQIKSSLYCHIWRYYNAQCQNNWSHWQVEAKSSFPWAKNKQGNYSATFFYQEMEGTELAKANQPGFLICLFLSPRVPSPSIKTLTSGSLFFLECTRSH